jgi:hypothetical protein
MTAAPRIAPSAALLLAAIVVSGFAAARLASPALWVVTPVVAALIFRAARRDAPIPRAQWLDLAELPAALRERVGSTFNQLPEGDARGLLLAVVNQARLLFGRGESRFDAAEERQLNEHVSGLVDACCVTAGDLARLDQFSMDAQSGTARTDLVARAAKARELFHGRLTSAAAALAALYTSDVEHGTPSTDRVAELTAEISADASARAAATAEISSLLGRENTP